MKTYAFYTNYDVRIVKAEILEKACEITMNELWTFGALKFYNIIVE